MWSQEAAVSTQPKPFLTHEQYLEMERQAEYKSEYWRGEMFAMAGASPDHNLLAGNLLASLHHQLRGRPCVVFPSDMRVFIPATGLYTYPDVTVVCGGRRLADQHRDTLLNPVLVAEILSPSTESWDRGRKFEHYRTVESLQQYLLVAQDRLQVDLYTRQAEGTWLLREARRLKDTLDLESIGYRILLADLYDKVDLPA